MSIYYQQNNTSAIYRDILPAVELPDCYNTIKTYRNFNNQEPLPTFNPRRDQVPSRRDLFPLNSEKKENSVKEEDKKVVTKLPKINPY